ncbi:MAG: 6-bladed beta-propeller [Candidatus Latescibacteria bacterium]|jgi:hypothetical protein|nr:6-bladed beta-propeller [Candidatus Latescibacterota bacterium]
MPGLTEPAKQLKTLTLILTLTGLLAMTACSGTDTQSDGMWRGRIEIEKGVERIYNDWPIKHHPDSLLQINFIEDLVISGQSENTESAFPQAYGIATGPNNEIYIADALNSRVLKFNEQGEFVASIGSKGHTPLQFQEPVDIAVDAEGKLYVVDYQIQRVTIFTPDLQLHDIFQVQVRQPRRIRVDAEGKILIFAITQHDLIYKYETDGSFIESFYDPLESVRIMGDLDQLIAYSDAGIATTDDGYVFISARHPYRIRKYDRVSGLNLEFSRTTPFDLSMIDMGLASEEGVTPVGQSGTLAVLPDGRIMNVLQYQEFTVDGYNSLGRPQLKLTKMDRWVDLFTADGKWELSSKIDVPGFPVHTDKKGRVYFNVLSPPGIVRYTPEFPAGAE